ncbi:hypothetical protein GCM10012278_44800 [Nonomuraea glycinis]|uniref:Uncharacterized protein n=1 Tax=Nonomuraea glycinis TaxID=2047744 RepID=A0A918A7R2_9ACTN|nr:hypothetical protein GCM10012278_44800 [Nonomuraea glycinis]
MNVCNEAMSHRSQPEDSGAVREADTPMSPGAVGRVAAPQSLVEAARGKDGDL